MRPAIAGVLAAAALAWAVPAAAQTPEDDYRAGVEARLAGDPAAAAERLSRVVAVEPANADAHLQLGLAWLALGRLDDAQASLARTLEIAPDYADARIGLARVAQRRGDRAAALAELDRLPPGNAEADELRRRLTAPGEPAATRWRLDVDGTYSLVEGDQPDWRDAYVTLGYRPTDETAIALGIEASSRFGRSDVYGELRVDHRFTDDVSLYVLFGGTPEADFRPEWQVGVGGAWRVSGGGSATVLRLDARQAEYRSGDIQTLTPGVEQYLLDGRVWLTGQWINIFDETGDHHGGWLARADALPRDDLRVFVGLADAPDVSEGVVVDTTSLFGGISWDVTERTTLRLSLAHEDRESGFDRTTFGLGLGLRF